MKLQKITSKKHPGAIFFKEEGTKDNFICKFYPGQEFWAGVFQETIAKQYYEDASTQLISPEPFCGYCGSHSAPVEGIDDYYCCPDCGRI